MYCVVGSDTYAFRTAPLNLFVGSHLLNFAASWIFLINCVICKKTISLSNLYVFGK